MPLENKTSRTLIILIEKTENLLCFSRFGSLYMGANFLNIHIFNLHKNSWMI